LEHTNRSKKGEFMIYRFGKLSIGLVVAAGLAACGGGGGGSSTAASAPNNTSSASLAALSSSNQTVASQDVASTAFSLFSTSQVALGAVSSSDSALYSSAFSHMDQLATYLADARANAMATGSVQSASYSCPSGGSFSVSVTDADNSGTVSTGDLFAINFVNCNEGSGAVSGSLSFRIDSLNGTYGTSPYNVSVTMTFGNLGVSATAYTGAINGSITVSGARTGAAAFTQSITTTSLSVTATYGGLTRSRALTNFNATQTRVPDATYTYLSSYSLAGTLTSSGFAGTQAVTFSTPTIFVTRAADFAPYTGVLLIKGANNSALRMTALNTSQVQLDLDANGDGVYEASNVVNWNTLL
jgi:hypothetical protein